MAKMSEERRKRQSEIMKQRWADPEARQKQITSHTGKHPKTTKPCAEETKRKIGEANRIKRTGVKQSEEHKQLRAAGMKAAHARKTPEEKAILRAKISAAKKAHPHIYTDEQRAKMSAAQKRWNASLTQEERSKRFLNFVRQGFIASSDTASDTVIEQFVAKFFEEIGIEFVQQYPIGSYTTDFYIPILNTIVEVNGCYWHGCEQCGYIDERAKAKWLFDKRRIGFIASQGYKIKIIWEHEIKQNILDVLLRIATKYEQTKEGHER